MVKDWPPEPPLAVGTAIVNASRLLADVQLDTQIEDWLVAGFDRTVPSFQFEVPLPSAHGFVFALVTHLLAG